MGERNDDGASAFERRAKQLFDDSTAAVDAATQSRLTQARHRAIESRAAASYGRRWSVLLPASACAAAAAVAWVLVGQAPSAVDAGLEAAPLGDLEVLLAEEDLELLDEELEFYGWLEEQPELADADDNVG